MAIYICATLISAFFAFLAQRSAEMQLSRTEFTSKYIISKPTGANNAYGLFVALSFFPLFVISAIRYGIGTDYFFTYAPMFQHLVNGDHLSNIDPGYYFLNRFVILFTKDYAGIFIVTSFLFCFFMYKAIFEQSTNPVYSILLLLLTTFYFSSLNGVRQAISIAMFFYAIKFIKQKKFVKYLIIILLASTIHLSALIFLPAYFFNRIRIRPLVGIILLLIETACLTLTRTVIFFMAEKTKYAYYLETHYVTGKFDYSNFLISIAILIFLYLFYHNAKENPDYIFFLNCQLSTCFLFILTYQIDIMKRFAVSYYYLAVISLPMMTSSEYIKDKRTRYFLDVLIVSLFFAFMFVSISVKGFGEVLPYRTIFDR